MSKAQDNIGGFLWRELTTESLADMTPREASNLANALYAGGITGGSRGDPQLVRAIAALRARAEQAEYMPLGLPQYNQAKHTADKAAAVSGAVRIMAVQIHANGSTVDVQLCDALTDGGEDNLVYSALDGDTLYFDYTVLGGIQFKVGLTVDLQGTGAVVIWSDQGQATA